ncbi:MAG: hypothetical protein KDA17_00510 [Candidatus Saccharibacteria bacterium]|nr:hypothetical protein [Candidatus Saccharibacteria bacterium]
MAAVTTSLLAAGTVAQLYGQQQQAKAAKKAANQNAENAYLNAQQAHERALEDERQFRVSFRRDTGANIAAIGRSGVKQEGSPLEVLRDNSANAERDAINIRKGGEAERRSYLRQAGGFRSEARGISRAAPIMGAATLLSGGANAYATGKKMGEF